MHDFVHTLGRFGTGRIDTENGNLSIICKDTDSIARVYRFEGRDEHSPFGRGWSVSLPEGEAGKISFTDGKLTAFTDAHGKSYTFLYRAEMLECITTPRGILFYEYNGDGLLSMVTYPDGTRVYISYSDVFNIHDITVKDARGNGVFALSYIYGIDGRIEYVYEYGYDGRERVELKFTDLSVPSEILSFTK